MEEKNWFKRNKGITMVISFLIIVIIGLFAWSQIERNNFDKKLEANKVEIITNARQIINESRKNLLLDVSRSLSWAVRSEITRNNYDQANQYLNEFVRARQYNLAVFADNDGNIVMSTDKRMEQTPIADYYEANITGVQDVSVQTLADNKWLAVAPVMGLNTRMGTLLIIYDPDAIADTDFINTQP